MHVVICGAGIGGLAAALTCLRAGIEVTLSEQSRGLREIGAGVQISSNGTKVLTALGLQDAIDAVGVRSQSFHVLSYESGEPIAEFPLGETASNHYGDVFYQLHRADLLNTLRAALPDGVLRLGARVQRIAQDAESASAILHTGEAISGDVLIGADGIHSAVRQSMGVADDARFSGKLVWRALVPADRVAEYDFGENFYGFAGRDRMVWAYWVRPGRQFNFGGVVPSDEVHHEGWEETGDLDELRAHSHGIDRVLQPKRRQYFSTVAGDLDPRANLAKASRLFQQCNFNASPQTGQGGGKAADARTADHNMHIFMPSV